MDANVRIVLPERSDDELSDGLRTLTEALCKAHPELDGGYGLGGPNGYGVHFTNDVFEMRKFYWGECDCGYNEAEEEFSAQYDHKDVPWADFKHSGHTTMCSMKLPNFRHKASGFEVRWYKWIGRDNEISGEHADVPAMLAECLASVGTPT